MSPRSPKPVGGTRILDEIQAFRETHDPYVTLGDLAQKLGMDLGLFSNVVHGKRRWPEGTIPRIAEILHPDGDASRREDLIKALKRPQPAKVTYPVDSASVRVLRQGHLAIDDLESPVVRDKDFSGPTGLLIKCFQRFADFAGTERLRPQPERVGLKEAIDGINQEVILLGNVATVSRIVTSHFFCLPVTLGVQGLISLGDLQDSPSGLALAARIRETMTRTSSGRRNPVAPIYMNGEIGSFLARSHLRNSQSVVTLEDFRVRTCARALVNASVADDRRAVLLVDEITCLLVLQEFKAGEVAVLFPELNTSPRFPFGFSVPRQHAALIRWLKAAWDLYLLTDAGHVSEFYLRTFEELETFGKAVESSLGKDYNQKARAWATRIMGLDSPIVTSTLVSNAWKPIVERVYREINSGFKH